MITSLPKSLSVKEVQSPRGTVNGVRDGIDEIIAAGRHFGQTPHLQVAGSEPMVRTPMSDLVTKFRRARLLAHKVAMDVAELRAQTAPIQAQLDTLARGLQQLDETAQARYDALVRANAAAVDQLTNRVAALETTLQSTLAALSAELAQRDAAARTGAVAIFEAAIRQSALSQLPANMRLLCTRRGNQLGIMLVAPDEAAALSSVAPQEIVLSIVRGEIDHAALWESSETIPLHGVIEAFASAPALAIMWLEQRCFQPAPIDAPRPKARLGEIVADIGRLDFYAHASMQGSVAPFDLPAQLPMRSYPQARTRSVLFLHNSYYHFKVLAEGLRARGWTAETVSLVGPSDPQQQFFHGEDVNLFDPDPLRMNAKIAAYFRTVPERFGAVHFYGMGAPTLFPAHFDGDAAAFPIPWDLLELRRHRSLIGYMPSGCLDGAPQSSIYAQTGGICERCVWQHVPKVCNDARSLAWRAQLEVLCDWIGLEGDHATPERIGPKYVHGPVVTALDPDMWRPDLPIPDDFDLKRAPDEILIYHAVGNYNTRRRDGRDLKGTGAVAAAIDELKGEGHNLRLVFAHDVKSTRVRFLQAQADIIVDQLNYGRYGANAREAMMLGKPTICHLKPQQAPSAPSLRAIVESPLVDATTDTITAVLRGLIRDPQRRRKLSTQSRAFGLAWHSAAACAERYEKVVDRVRAGLPADASDLYPPPPKAEASVEPRA